MNANWDLLEIAYGSVFNHEHFEEERIYKFKKAYFTRPGFKGDSQWPTATEGAVFECDYPAVTIHIEHVAPEGVKLKVGEKSFEIRQRNDYWTLYDEEGVFGTYLEVRATLL